MCKTDIYRAWVGLADNKDAVGELESELENVF
jgi:hypothetical protein